MAGMPGVCKHMGAAVGKERCPTCRGDVQVKVFECALHKRCTYAKKVPRITCCGQCQDGPVTLSILAHGIGDSLMALTSAAGLQRAGKQVVFCCPHWNESWVRLFGGYDALLTSTPIGRNAYVVCGGIDQGPTATLTRAELYASRCLSKPVLPERKPLSDDAQRWAEQYRDAVVLAPWSAFKDREWSLANWLELEVLLQRAGRRVVILDGCKGRTEPFQGEWVLGESPERVAALADVTELIGNDSGMCHLFGIRQRPAVAVCGPTQGERIFDIYGTVRTIRSPDGRLDSITPDMVMGVLNV